MSNDEASALKAGDIVSLTCYDTPYLVMDVNHGHPMLVIVRRMRNGKPVGRKTHLLPAAISKLDTTTAREPT